MALHPIWDGMGKINRYPGCLRFSLLFRHRAGMHLLIISDSFGACMSPRGESVPVFPPLSAGTGLAVLFATTSHFFHNRGEVQQRTGSRELNEPLRRRAKEFAMCKGRAGGAGVVEN